MTEIIPKQNESRISGATLLFLLALAVFLGISFFFFLTRSTEVEVDIELRRTREELARGKTPEEKQLERTILRTREKLEDFARVSSNAAHPAPVFRFLEERTHPNVTFTQLNLQPKSFQAALSGSARDFQSLDEQMNVLKERTELISSRLSNIGLGPDGQVAFHLDLVFQSSFLKE